jgi:DeoR/GlpR family transcriptional regulator of sugar metabolism
VHYHSFKTYVIADHTKFGVVKRIRTFEINQIDSIVTDCVSEDFMKKIKSLKSNLEII